MLRYQPRMTFRGITTEPAGMMIPLQPSRILSQAFTPCQPNRKSEERRWRTTGLTGLAFSVQALFQPPVSRRRVRGKR